MMLKRQLMPFIILFFLFSLLGYELFYAKPNELPSALIGEALPSFQLNNLYESQSPFNQEELKGQVLLLNFWASWCSACHVEHAMLMKISREYQVPIYGIAYKDKQEEAIAWLSQNGNPYKKIGNDVSGDVAIDFGVYGTPETYVISKEGKIVYKHIGAIDQKTWDEVLYPVVNKYR